MSQTDRRVALTTLAALASLAACSDERAIVAPAAHHLVDPAIFAPQLAPLHDLSSRVAASLPDGARVAMSTDLGALTDALTRGDVTDARSALGRVSRDASTIDEADARADVAVIVRAVDAVNDVIAKVDPTA